MSAAVAIANAVKSSLGPCGLDKMMVDDIGVRNHFLLFVRDVTNAKTNDALARSLRMLPFRTMVLPF